MRELLGRVYVDEGSYGVQMGFACDACSTAEMVRPPGRQSNVKLVNRQGPKGGGDDHVYLCWHCYHMIARRLADPLAIPLPEVGGP